MGVEIERKFLVIDDSWRDNISRRLEITQGYLANTEKCSIRVRMTGESSDINIKSMTPGISRTEFEYPVPVDQATELLDSLCVKPLIRKTRFIVHHAGRDWEIDVFKDENEGLVIAELELDDHDTRFELPGWLGEEVTDDLRYYNISLVERPYRIWRDRGKTSGP